MTIAGRLNKFAPPSVDNSDYLARRSIFRSACGLFSRDRYPSSDKARGHARDFISPPLAREGTTNFFTTRTKNRYEQFGFRTLVDRHGIVSGRTITRLIIATVEVACDTFGVSEDRARWNFGRYFYTRAPNLLAARTGPLLYQSFSASSSRTPRD